MSVVVDASAVVAALLDDGGAGRWCETRLSEGDLVAPHLMPVEVANVIRRSELRRLIDGSEAAAAFADLRRLAVELVPFEPLAERAWELRANLTMYDASYVATAELVDGPLVTLDQRLAAAPGVRCAVDVAPGE